MYRYVTVGGKTLKVKRLLAGVLAVMMIPMFSMFSSFAAADATEEETVAPTKPPVTAQEIGMEKYIKLLEKTYYKGNLGATYEKNKTTFKVWSPLATNVNLCIYNKGTDEEEGAQMISKTKMHLVERYGTWVLELKGDYKNKYYTYEVTVNGKTNEVVDPYAKACGANGNRGMVVDLASTNPKGWEKDSFKRVANPTDAVIWEVSVRDFSASDTSGVSEKHRGKFLAFTENGTVVDSVDGSLSTCVDYLKKLGVNYVQINPFYDFQSIDETDTVTPQYNWGYDPKNYNVPEGSYSTNPYDGNVRIKECKQMIKALHDAGIGVIMDVVYNHTYESNNSWFNLIVPDYYYRIDDNGNWSNGSGCGNDTASERIMFREFMKNSVVYWAQEYHIDGFRFDLMGLHDVDTMNYIRTSLDKLPNGGRILMYGEAWDMHTNCDPSVKLANQKNLSSLSTRIAAFNDTFRDGIKGNVFDKKDKGFIQQGKSRSKVKAGITGMTTITAWGTPARQCVNYASCHDNLSLYDKLVSSVYDDYSNYRLRKEDLVSMNKLSAAITLTSQGIPFMMAGEEMARSKDGDENSYKSPVEINQIDWNDINKYADLTEYYGGLIDIRKTIDILRDNTGYAAENINYLTDLDDGVIAYTIKGSGNTKAFAAVFNGSDKPSTLTLPSDLCQTWVIIANDERAGITNLGEINDNKVTVKPHSCVLLVNKSSFAYYSNVDDTSVVTVEYVDTSSDTVVYQQILKGKAGSEYSFEYPNSLLYNYNIASTAVSKSGTFKDSSQKVSVKVEPYDGEFSNVTINFVNENNEQIADTIVMSNRVGQYYTTPKIAGVKGYALDLENLPANGAGEYTSTPIIVTYKYKKVDTDAVVGADADKKPVGIANVIYMNDIGEILETKTYKGDVGSSIEIEYIDIDGHTVVSDTSDGAQFSDVETNIIVNYKQNSYVLLIVIVAGSVLVLTALIFAIVLYKKKHPKSQLVSKVGDDLLIEE